MSCTITIILYILFFVGCSIWNYKTAMRFFVKEQKHLEKIEKDNSRMRILLELQGTEQKGNKDD